MRLRRAPSAFRRAAPAVLALMLAGSGCRPGTPALARSAAESPAARAVPTPPGLGLYVPAWDVASGGPPTPAQVALGRRLFFDTGMSRDGSVSCGTCHLPELAFTDGRPVAVGVGGATGRRNSPTLVNRAYGASQFWDGRAGSLEQQVLRPIADPVELGSSVDEELARLRSDPGYVTSFADAFGAPPDSGSLAAALAAFVGSIFSSDSSLDRYLAGDALALGAEARRGRRLFTGRARCAQCHMGPNLTDEGFHNTGVAWRGGPPADSGRWEVTGKATDIGAFKTPTLREAPLTAPYMHDGSIGTLEEVVDFYDRGGHPNRHLDPRVLPLGLSDAERADLLAFLRALTGRGR